MITAAGWFTGNILIITLGIVTVGMIISLGLIILMEIRYESKRIES